VIGAVLALGLCASAPGAMAARDSLGLSGGAAKRAVRSYLAAENRAGGNQGYWVGRCERFSGTVVTCWAIEYGVPVDSTECEECVLTHRIVAWRGSDRQIHLRSSLFGRLRRAPPQGRAVT
jgi:hypothetical protein